MDAANSHWSHPQQRLGNPDAFGSQHPPSLPAMEGSSCFVNAAKSEALQSSSLFVIPSLPVPKFRFFT